MAGTDISTEKKITREYAEHFIKTRSWYQTIKFEDDLISRGCAWCGEMAWSHMLQFLPESLEGMRILDLGCNAGLFCIKAALMGAKEVVGVDWPGWRHGWDFIEQREFVQNYFEQKHGRKLPITYYTERMEEFLHRENLGRFDYAFVIASIYYTQDPEDVVQRISYIADNVIVRMRGEDIINRFSRLFSYSGYLETKAVQERCWEELDNIPTDDFYMFFYKKNREVDYYRLTKGHRELIGTNEPLNIWQLMNLVGTEIPVERYQKRIPEEFISYIPLNKFPGENKHSFVPTEEQKRKYPWDSLAASIKNRGFVIPIIAEKIKDQDMYLKLEGSHRLAAVAMQEPYDPEYLIPCVVVEHE